MKKEELFEKLDQINAELEVLSKEFVKSKDKDEKVTLLAKINSRINRKENIALAFTMLEQE